MVRFEKISTTEKNYPYVDAVVAADYKNGTFGNVSNGKFTATASGTFVLKMVMMQNLMIMSSRRTLMHELLT